ncbi:aspartate aminotransferase family protein [Ktedonosporobacter rubrisoli]|nr:aspartate aminotransferase family protein [Ktedonosporobacter rubrisoli]
MSLNTQKSKELFERSRGLMIEGGSSSSRGPVNYGAYPLFMQRGQGSRIYDVDGNSYIDWLMSYGALPLGHAHPRVVEALCQAAASGSHFATATDIEIEVAEMIQRIVPSAERVRFANTGTEATMAAVRLARGYTGKPKFIKFEGHYHGWYDDYLVSSNPQPLTTLGHRNDPIKIPDSSGLNRHALDDTIVVPWNDLGALERAIDTYRGQIAAILSEGIMANMGIIPPAEGYLQGLQELARKHNILFILDETVTGFRIAAGGCQQYYQLQPDITTFGKALGAGLPVAGIVGRAEVMEALSWGGVLHYGTQNASRIGLHAARASLQVLTEDDGAAFHQIWRIADLLCNGLRELFKELGVAAIVQNVGPMLQILFTERPAISDYREYCQYVDRPRYQRFIWELFKHGVYTTPSATLHSIVSLAHSEQDVEITLAAARKVLAHGTN